MNKILIFDCDSQLYQASSAAEADDISNKFLFAQRFFRKLIRDVCHELNTDRYMLCLERDDGNFRKAILPEYKAKRDPNNRPKLYNELKAWISFYYPVKSIPNIEAEDLAGILATSEEYIGKSTIISIDKDLLTVNANIWNPNKKVFTPACPNRARYYLYKQTLSGDSIDGYAGLPKVGNKTAEKILAEDFSWTGVVEAYKKCNKTEEDAIVQARCAKILEHDLFDYKTMQPILWTPKKLINAITN